MTGKRQASPAVAAALTDPQAYANSSDEIRRQCKDHILDAVDQVMDADTPEERRRRLGMLPPHIKEMAEEWIKASWNAYVVGSYGLHDVELRHMPLWGTTLVVCPDKTKGA